MNRIFPIEIMENSVELHRYRHLKRSRVIYTILLLSVSFLILLMFIVKIDLFTTSPGVIKVGIQSDMIVECLVSPTDIGLLKINDRVNFQIDALNYHQREMAKGKILQINYDLSMVEDKLKYKVICSLNKTSLFLSNKTPLYLKTGMNLTAKFNIANRTVFQLLFDKIGDWQSLS